MIIEEKHAKDTYFGGDFVSREQLEVGSIVIIAISLGIIA